jgi:hypothetical protein
MYASVTSGTIQPGKLDEFLPSYPFQAADCQVLACFIAKRIVFK